MLVRPLNTEFSSWTYDVIGLVNSARSEISSLDWDSDELFHVPNEWQVSGKEPNIILYSAISAFIVGLIIGAFGGFGGFIVGFCIGGGLCALMNYPAYSGWHSAVELTDELNRYRARVMAHNARVQKKLDERRRLREIAEREEQERQRQQQIRLDAQLRREWEILSGSYKRFEAERMRRAETVAATITFLRAVWADFLIASDVSHIPFDAEQGFRQTFWRRFNAAVQNETRTYALLSIREINDPRLRQPISYLEPELPPPWPPLEISPEWRVLKETTFPVIKQALAEYRAIAHKKGLELYIDLNP
ncbi:hypothetical protein OSH11_24480 [Kaistia dalseonensis]|uniref:Uncharacterized protein n=1 Tax=Kaistia dalseonensis TaxID=410840 RepID=A0ABU0HDX0_9HYPH|nr:hypothetical protein [Kaistia dalseonensis]MCX5497877.1 hypothetical protein [Kaistia dalseonensis]MDQ0440521.1 hypothetical protein [Kaistia dalseonensis]